jgi:hypothetical protein
MRKGGKVRKLKRASVSFSVILGASVLKVNRYTFLYSFPLWFYFGCFTAVVKHFFFSIRGPPGTPRKIYFYVIRRVIQKSTILKTGGKYCDIVWSAHLKQQ